MATLVQYAFNGLSTGLVGTLSYSIVDRQYNVVVPPTTEGFVEWPTGSGCYQLSLDPSITTSGWFDWFDGQNHRVLPWGRDSVDLTDNPNPAALQSAADALLDGAAAIDPSGSAGETLRQALRLILASTAGELSGAATATNTIKDTSGTKNRIVAQVNPATGDRESIAYDAT